MNKEHSRLVQAATAASKAAKWSRLLRTIALGDATAEPRFGADSVHAKLCNRLREHKAAKTKALKELKAFEGTIVFRFFCGDHGRLDADQADKILSPDLQLNMRSNPPPPLPGAPRRVSPVLAVLAVLRPPLTGETSKRMLNCLVDDWH